MTQARRFRPGDVVKGRFVDGNWYLAEVQEVCSDGTCVVTWLDGDTQDRRKRSEDLICMRFDSQQQCYQEDKALSGEGQDLGTAAKQLEPQEAGMCPVSGPCTDLYSVTRRRCTACECRAFQQCPEQSQWNGSVSDSACSQCGCSAASHKLVDAVMGTSHAGLRFEVPLPPEACTWNQRELGLFLSSRGEFHPPHMSARRRSFGLSRSKGGRVSIVSSMMESQQDFHEQLWAVFNTQDWPDKELVVVETYVVSPSPFFSRKAMEDERIVFAPFRVQPDDDFSSGLKRNMCAHLSSGRYLATFDCADLYAPSYISQMVEAMRVQQVCAVTLSSWLAFDPQSGSLTHVDTQVLRAAHGAGLADRWLLGHGFSHVLTRSLALQLGYPHRNSGEEYDLFVRIRSAGLQESALPADPACIALLPDKAGICLHTLHFQDASRGLEQDSARGVAPERHEPFEVTRLGEALALYLQAFPSARRALKVRCLGTDMRGRAFRVHASWGEDRPAAVLSVEGPPWATAADVRALVADAVGCPQSSVELFRGIRPRGEWLPEGSALRDRQRIDPRTTDLWAALAGRTAGRLRPCADPDKLSLQTS